MPLSPSGAEGSFSSRPQVSKIFLGFSWGLGFRVSGWGLGFGVQGPLEPETLTALTLPADSDRLLVLGGPTLLMVLFYIVGVGWGFTALGA